jgi:hypothetical protein
VPLTLILFDNGTRALPAFAQIVHIRELIEEDD